MKKSFKADTHGCLQIFSKYADHKSLCLQNVSKLVIRDSFLHLKYSDYIPDKVSSFLPMLTATTTASSLFLHPSGKTTPPVSSRLFNWRSAYSVSNSSRIVCDIPCPYLCVILMSSVLFVSDLMAYGKSIL